MLKGRVALITGASRGLGREIAQTLLDSGASVAILARPSADLQETAAALARKCLGHAQRVLQCPADLALDGAVDSVLERVLSELGRLDILINNAGLIGPIGPLDQNEWDEWMQTVKVNLFAPVALMRAAIPLMRAQGSGKIINLSGGGATAPRANFTAYAAAKVGLVRVTETVAEELKGTGIDVNAVAPGALNTRMLEDVLAAGPARVGASAYQEALTQRAYGGASPKRAADLVAFLASPVSDGISGRLISAIWDPWETFENRRNELAGSDIYTLRRIGPEDRGKDWTGSPIDRPVTSVATMDASAQVAVTGLWHLGIVVAACLASRGIPTVAYEPDGGLVEALSAGRLPVFEPGLDDLVRDGLARRTLRITSDPHVLTEVPILWAAWDTFVTDGDRADFEGVIGQLTRLFPHLHDDCLIVISSQLPVGTVRRLEQAYAAARPSGRGSFACIPENLRIGNAIEAFTQPDRIVAGVRSDRDAERIRALLAPFRPTLQIMRVESAELTKHALNAFLATSVTFINEVARVAELVGADAHEVERGLKSDARIGRRAYLRPGGPYAGGTLGRDVEYLIERSTALGHPPKLFRAVRESNDVHKSWTYDTLSRLLHTLDGTRIAVLGLTYKPGTDSLRRSGSIELCERLSAAGATVVAYDPVVSSLPVDLTGTFSLASSPLGALRDAKATVVATEWPIFRSLSSDDFLGGRLSAIVIDPGGFLAASLEGDARVRYARVGTSL